MTGKDRPSQKDVRTVLCKKSGGGRGIRTLDTAFDRITV
jgi:hypothetical protein